MVKPIFISGCPRSGTSILAHLLGRNNKVFSYLEPSGFYKYFNEFFLPFPIPFTLFKQVFACIMPSRLVYSISAQEIPRERVNPEEYFSRRYILKEMKVFDSCTRKTDYVNTFNKFAHSVFGDFARFCGKERWCVKRPGYLYSYIDQIYRIHPNMKFIHIIRDGRDVIASLIDQDWVKKDNKFNYALNRFWIDVLNKGHENSKSIPDDCLLTVKLEDLLSSQDEEIERICSFIEVEYDDSMQSYARERLSRESLGRWKRDLTREQVGIIIRKGGHLLKRYGYI